VKLSKQDLKILELLQIDVKTSVERLSEEVGLSAASIQRHLKRLRDNKVIAQEVAIISPDSVNQSMTFIISVQLNRSYNDCFNYFKNKVKNNNNIPPAISLPEKLVDPIFIATNSLPNILKANSKLLEPMSILTIFLSFSIIVS